MSKLKDYEHLYALNRKASGKYRTASLVLWSIFVLGFVTLMFDFIPFGLTTAMILCVIPSFAFTCFWLTANLITKRNLRAFTPQQLAVMDADVGFKAAYDNIVVTREAVIGAKAGLELIPIENLLWIYNKVSTVKYLGFIPIHKNTSVVFAGRNHKRQEIRVSNNGYALDFLQDEIFHYRQDVVFGYERGVEDIYNKDIGRLIAFANECAEKRQKGTV